MSEIEKETCQTRGKIRNSVFDTTNEEAKEFTNEIFEALLKSINKFFNLKNIFNNFYEI